ncbi:variant erythrocyte surface antigen-1 family protein [Babesia divergens]|uniref:Variant erythrocyte surface antigen-1 family protein n=1 Tax=Babesia divergens TaxID=32595 RepID=A0AAD9LEU2_BABDI|nr:variant erythrocyte surface antigen-1 family protein [Babesia divergens]
MTTKVCCMYYTDVFVGQNNINDLENAVNAVLKESGLTGDFNALDQLTNLANELAKFVDGIGKTGGSKYESSYSKDATWDELCRNCSCRTSNPSCPCFSSGSSSFDKCCENCDVKKAAKIFLGFLPCLYYALKYLNEKCDEDSDWKNNNINETGLGHFLTGLGFDVEKLNVGQRGSVIPGFLKDLFSPDGPLKKLYDVSENYFTSFPSSPVPSSDSKDVKTPSTVREMLLWLSGLPFTSGFEALLNHCKDLCSAITDPFTSDKFKASLFDSCFLSPFVLGAIEDSEDKSGELPPYKSEWQVLAYPEDPSDLLEKLCEYVSKIYVPLRLLHQICSLDPSEAGWKYCYYGKKCAEKLNETSPGSASSDPSHSASPECKCDNSDKYLCTWATGSQPHAHDHCLEGDCIGPKGACNGKMISGARPQKDHTKSMCKPCSHPLQAFLLDGSKDSPSSPFKLPEDSTVPPMGFKAESLISPARNGWSLYQIVLCFCTAKADMRKRPTADSPFLSLLQFLICISSTPPDSLLELFAFLVKFAEALKSKAPQTDPLHSKFASYASEEPGGPDGEELKKAVENLYGSHSKGDHTDKSPAYDLLSLYGCHVPKRYSNVTCGPYLDPLIADASDLFVDDFLGTYLSYICYLPDKLKEKLEEFQRKFLSSCSHCKSSCKNIVVSLRMAFRLLPWFHVQESGHSEW